VIVVLFVYLLRAPIRTQDAYFLREKALDEV
jgi:hypothetical protein